MLRGRSPQGLRGAVYLLICSFIYLHYLSVNMRLLMLLIRGQGILNSVYICEDYTGLEQENSVVAELQRANIVVFEISPSKKNFTTAYNAYNYHQVLPAAVRRLYVGSTKSEDQQVCRPHYIQVQSPISRTKALNINYILKVCRLVAFSYKVDQLVFLQ